MIIAGELGAHSQARRKNIAVKVCGISEARHALVAAASGAEMVGMVFAPSRRQVSVERAREICRALERSEKRPLTVGVFVNEEPKRMREIAREVGLDSLQMSGDESPRDVVECAYYYPVIKALRFPPGTTPEAAEEHLHLYETFGLGSRIRFLLDAYHPHAYGGTGSRGDWTLAAELASQYSIILAGGLNPHNVAYAIAAVDPWGVDVSSGVEEGGVKDPQLIEAFVGAARIGDRLNVARCI